MAEHAIMVEVVYADVVHQHRRQVTLPGGSTVLQAVDASGIKDVLPGGLVDQARLGIFSRRVSAQQVLKSGDRIEIYRSLTVDPMDARRRRAGEG